MRQEGSNMLSIKTNGCVTAPTFIILGSYEQGHSTICPLNKINGAWSQAFFKVLNSEGLA